MEHQGDYRWISCTGSGMAEDLCLHFSRHSDLKEPFGFFGDAERGLGDFHDPTMFWLLRWDVSSSPMRLVLHRVPVLTS